MNGWATEEERRNVAREPANVFDRPSLAWTSGKSGARNARYISWMPWPTESRITLAVSKVRSGVLTQSSSRVARQRHTGKPIRENVDGDPSFLLSYHARASSRNQLYWGCYL